MLKRLAYTGLGKGERGVVLAYLRCTSGYSRSQVTRLVGRWESNRLATVPLAKRYSKPTVPFARKYTNADIELLVEMDRANEDVCGPAIVHLLQRAFYVYGDQRYERLSKLSVPWSAKERDPCVRRIGAGQHLPRPSKSDGTAVHISAKTGLHSLQNRPSPAYSSLQLPRIQ